MLIMMTSFTTANRLWFWQVAMTTVEVIRMVKSSLSAQIHAQNAHVRYIDLED